MLCYFCKEADNPGRRFLRLESVAAPCALRSRPARGLCGARPFPSGFLSSSCGWKSGSSKGPAVFCVPLGGASNLGKEREREGPITAALPARFNGLCGQWPVPADPQHRGRRSLDLAGQMCAMLGRATPRDQLSPTLAGASGGGGGGSLLRKREGCWTAEVGIQGVNSQKRH